MPQSEPEPTFKMEPAACPCCGYVMDSSTVTSVQNRETEDAVVRAPEPGDASLCIRCTSILMFGEPGQLLCVTSEMWAEWGEGMHTELQRAADAAAMQHVARDGWRKNTVISRGPGDWRAALAFRNGLYVVSYPYPSRGQAKRALATAQSALAIGVKGATDMTTGTALWYALPQLLVFSQEVDLIEGVWGPYLSEAQMKQESAKLALALGKELGITAPGVFAVPGKGQN
jgi:hypothetical protein